MVKMNSLLGFAGRSQQRQQRTGVRGRRGEIERGEICLWRLCTRRRFVVAVADARGSLSMSSRFFHLFELLFWWWIALECAGLISYSYNPPSASWRGSRRVSEIHAPTKDPERDANKDAKNMPLLIRFLMNSLVIYGAFVACLLYDTNCFLLE